MSCSQDSASADGGVSFRFLPQAQSSPAGLVCEPAAGGEGINGAAGVIDIGALRLQVRGEDRGVVFDETLAVTGQRDQVLFEGIPVGSRYSLGASACRTLDGDAVWVGQDQGLSVREARNTRSDMVLLPEEGFACAQDAPSALAFMSAFSPDGRRVLIAGGLTSWTGQGAARATDAVRSYDLFTGETQELDSVLPAPMAMAASVSARQHPSAPLSLVMVGAVQSIVEGADSRHGNLLPFGPGADSGVSRALWVEEGGASQQEEAWPLTPRFAPGLGVTEVDGVSVVAVIGGVTYAELGATVSDTVEVVRLTAEGPVSVSASMTTQRVGATTVELEPGLLIIIGGNVGNPGALVELLDVRGENPIIKPLTISPAQGVAAEVAALARPSAFPSAIALSSGTSVVVVGGLPVFTDDSGGDRVVAPAAIEPVIYRLNFASTESGLAILDSPPLFGSEATRSLSQRALAMTVRGTGSEVWVMGGVSADISSPFVPRGDGLRVSLETGDVSQLEEVPYGAVGALVTPLGGGQTLVHGGVVEVGQNQLETTEAVLVRRGDGAPTSCDRERAEP